MSSTLIGKGAFGSVYKIEKELENRFYALKKIKFKIDKNEDIRNHKFLREM